MFVYVNFTSLISLLSLFNAHNHLLDIDQMSRYVSPINPAVYPHLSVTLLSIGLFFMAWFFVYPCSKLHMHTNSTPWGELSFCLNLVHWICWIAMVDILELVHGVQIIFIVFTNSAE